MAEVFASSDDRACLVALVGVPGVGPARLRVLLERDTPAVAWRRLVAGAVEPDADTRITSELVATWRTATRHVDPAARMEALETAGVRAILRGDAEYPPGVEAIVDPPAVLFVTGPAPPAAFELAVAVVGTRRCTRYGYETARRIGRELAGAGVRVVSGLALGIDGAAHLGALEALEKTGAAPPLGVVASGLDIVYPRRHRRLWAAVASSGALVSEAALGVEPEKWRFPARNRIIVGLASAVVVVESHEQGGALITAELAVDHDVPVYVVPGPVHNAASVGTNRLLGDAGRPLIHVAELLADLGVAEPRRSGRGLDRGPRLSGPARRALGGIGWAATSLDEIVASTGLSVDVSVEALDELVRAGVVSERSGWFEQVPPGRRR